METESTSTPQFEKRNGKQYMVAVAAGAIAIVGIWVFLELRSAPAESEVGITVPPLSNRTAELATYLGTHVWQIDSVTDAKGTFAISKTYRIVFADGQMSGVVCNQFMAPYRLEDDGERSVLRFSLIQSTKVLCSESEMRPEHAITEALPAGIVVTTEADGRVVLTGRDTDASVTLSPVVSQ